MATCVSCDRPLCRECAVSTPVGFKCPDCGGHGSGPGEEAGARRWLRPALAAVAVLVLGAVGWTALGGGESGAPTDVGLPEAVRFTGPGGVRLAGLVDLPAPEGDRAGPGVLIVPGFGAATKVGLGAHAGNDDPLYRELGAQLSAAGITVLRYDKRGTADSDPLPPDSTPTFEDRVGDARAALETLRERDDVDPERVAVLGHGEGGLVAMRLAAGEEPPAATALINTWGRPFVDVLATEFVRDLPPGENLEVHQGLADTLRERVRLMLEDGRYPDPEELPEILRPVFPPGREAYMRELFSIDPAELAADVDGPTLLVHGGMDPCVQLEEDIHRLRDAIAGPVDVLQHPDAGHTLMVRQQTGSDAHGPDEHGPAGQMDPQAQPSPATPSPTPTTFDPHVPDDQEASVLQRDTAALEEIADWVAGQLTTTG